MSQQIISISIKDNKLDITAGMQICDNHANWATIINITDLDKKGRNEILYFNENGKIIEPIKFGYAVKLDQNNPEYKTISSSN